MEKETSEELKKDLELFRTNLSEVKKICKKIYKTDIIPKKTKNRLNEQLREFNKQKVYKEEAITLQKENEELQNKIDYLLNKKFRKTQRLCLYEFICDMKLISTKENNCFNLKNKNNESKLEIEDKDNKIFFKKNKFLNKNRNVKNDHIIPLYKILCKFTDDK